MLIRLPTWDVTANWECFGSEGVFADDEGPAEDAGWWCRPTLIRAKVGLKGGGRFISSSYYSGAVSLSNQWCKKSVHFSLDKYSLYFPL